MQNFNIFDLKAFFFNFIKIVLLLDIITKNYFKEITYTCIFYLVLLLSL